MILLDVISYLFHTGYPFITRSDDDGDEDEGQSYIDIDFTDVVSAKCNETKRMTKLYFTLTSCYFLYITFGIVTPAYETAAYIRMRFGCLASFAILPISQVLRSHCLHKKIFPF